MDSSEEEWFTDSSDQEAGPLGDVIGGEEDTHHNQETNAPVHARTLTDPWQQYKYENEAKVRKVLNDNILVETIKSTTKSSSKASSMRNYPSYMFGRSHGDLFSPITSVAAGFDILCRLVEVEEALVGKILGYCSTATLYSMRLVCKQWAEMVMSLFMKKEKLMCNNWSNGVPSKEEFKCPSVPSVIAVDDFTIVVGMENGKLCVFSRLTGDCELLWVAHDGMVAALHVIQDVILSCGKEVLREEVGKVKVWGRQTGRYLRSVKPPFKHDLKYEDVFSYILVKHSYLLAMGIDKDVWIWKIWERELNENERQPVIPEINIQFRLKGHYSPVLCCDMDEQGHIMTGSQDAQVRLWNLGPDLRDRSHAVACHNQHGNPVTAVRILWPLGMSASSGSVRLYYHPTGACLRTIRFSKYVFDLHMDFMHFVTSHQDGSVNFWSLSDCLVNSMQVTKSTLHKGNLLVKPPLEDQDVWGNQFVARQGKFVKEMSCLVTMHEKKVVVYDYWATRGTRRECEGRILRNCDTPSSLPSLVSDVSDEEVWEEDLPHLLAGAGLFLGGGAML